MNKIMAKKWGNIYLGRIKTLFLKKNKDIKINLSPNYDHVLKRHLYTLYLFYFALVQLRSALSPPIAKRSRR